jgi:ornithine cyclodeaminase/alanine dehydrogenase-like protein (mu-crystallin family)
MEGKKEINAGIIGSGFAAGFHIEALRRVYGTGYQYNRHLFRNPENAKVFRKL